VSALELQVEALHKQFPVGNALVSRGRIHAVDDVTFSLRPGTITALVGESGSGKSTVARLLVRLYPPTSGQIVFGGQDVARAKSRREILKYRSQVQMIFQDPFASLNPARTIRHHLERPLRIHEIVPRNRIDERVDELLETVGLVPPEKIAKKYPHELSGGQRQRVNVARALAMEPRLLILDEAVSALDKSVEAQVLNLLRELKARLALTFIFISHDLSVVRFISDRVLVMYLGKVVEIGPVDRIYDEPRHPYTKALLASRPSMDPKRRRHAPPLTGDPPSPIDPPSGCRFRTRCALAEGVCATREPALAEQSEGHFAACLAATPGSGHSAAAA